MNNGSQPRIEIYENGRRIALTKQAPIVHACVSSDHSAILEKHLVPEAMEYPERSLDTHLVFLSDSQPVRALCRTEGRQYSARLYPGSLWIIPRSMSYRCVFEGPHGGVVLSIANWLFETAGRGVEPDFQFNSRDRQLEYLLRALLEFAKERQQPDALLGDLLVQAVCARVANGRAISKFNEARHLGGLSSAQLSKVLEYIDANLDHSISLSMLAEAVNLSMHHFAVSFRKSTGFSPHRYILLQRMRRAQQLLRDRERTVLDVALEVGFEHQSNFARAFRRVTGASPNEFRRDRC